VLWEQQPCAAPNGPILVTRAGEILDAAGVITGGQSGATGGLLQRRREVLRLEDQSISLMGYLEEGKQRRERLLAQSQELRERMGEAAIKGAKAINYEGAGTIEFLVDKHGDFYFMEMNTRIQVEHPITEEVTNYDLIKEQIKVAAGVPISGTNYYPNLFAMECRINAEDPANGFRPSPGKIINLHKPGGHGVRVDSHVYAGYTIPSNYDSMIGKLIVTGQSREEVITRMKRALSEFIIEGVKTTIPFHLKLMDNPIFRSGKFTTKFLETSFDFSDLK
ncbi:MAG: hypothetical protein ABL895_08790, partial [Cyclobacteriaceae bacterium]